MLQLEDEVGAPYPEHVNANQQELLTLLAFMQVGHVFAAQHLP